jgi:hypothetical protein
MTTVRELAYKLWKIRSLHGVHDDHIRDYFDAEKLLNNQWLKEGALVNYSGDEYEFGYVGQTGKVILYKLGERNMQDSIVVNIEDINVIDPAR